MTILLCSCGVPVGAERPAHLYFTFHDCVEHRPDRCRVCVTIRQIEDYLSWCSGQQTGEAA